MPDDEKGHLQRQVKELQQRGTKLVLRVQKQRTLIDNVRALVDGKAVGHHSLQQTIQLLLLNFDKEETRDDTATKPS